MSAGHAGQTIPVYKDGPLEGQKLQGRDLEEWRAKAAEQRAAALRAPLATAEAARQAAEEARATAEVVKEELDQARRELENLRRQREAEQAWLRQCQRERQAGSPIMRQTSSVSTDPYATDINYDPRVRQVERETAHMPDTEALRHINLVKAEVAKERRSQAREQERRDGTLWTTVSGDLLCEDRTPQQTSIVHQDWGSFSDHAPGGPAAAHTAAVPPWQAARNMAPPRGTAVSGGRGRRRCPVPKCLVCDSGARQIRRGSWLWLAVSLF